jgi:hypothetical protein
LLLAASCARPAQVRARSASVEAELLAAEQQIFDAIAHRDPRALGAITEVDFVLRYPGTADVRRDDFLAHLSQIPGGMLDVRGEQLEAHPLAPDVGVVSGVQVSRLQIDGKEIVDRGAFTDVFRRGTDGRWRVAFAHVVPLDNLPSVDQSRHE